MSPKLSPSLVLRLAAGAAVVLLILRSPDAQALETTRWSWRETHVNIGQIAAEDTSMSELEAASVAASAALFINAITHALGGPEFDDAPDPVFAPIHNAISAVLVHLKGLAAALWPFEQRSYGAAEGGGPRVLLAGLSLSDDEQAADDED